jgi:MinD-like ATPase involved in chromosome partitioning or flagellar assembly
MGVNPGVSTKDAGQRALIDRVNQPMRGPRSIAVLSQKGGVGKTTVTVGLGATLTATRGDRVIAVDANPDFGTLAQRGPDETGSTVRDVLLDENIVRYSDMRTHTSQTSSRLEILASERDPATSEAFSEADYRGVMSVLQRFAPAARGPLGLDINEMARQFLPRVRGLHVIPFDDHLADGSEIHLQLLSVQTRQAFLELAATIADALAVSAR